MCETGEAVAIGMELAAQIALRMELWGPDSVERQRALLHAYGLPTAIGAAEVRDDVPQELVRAVVELAGAAN